MSHSEFREFEPVRPMDPATRAKLRRVSTPTLATLLFKRGLRNQMIQGVLPLRNRLESMVGEAFTLRYIPAREDLDTISVFADHSHPQRAAIEGCPRGHVLVIDSHGDPRAASAGGILVTRLMMRGAAGIVTDGGLRDSLEIAALDIPAYHRRPSAPTNLTRHHAVDINVPIGCGEAPVFPGDVIVGDSDGAIVIPAEIADELAAEATEMTAYEDFVIERVKAGHSTFGLYPPSDPNNAAMFQAWRERHRR